MGMFEKASRLRLRFAVQGGNLSTEDLWGLPLTSKSRASLDGLARELSKQVKESDEESFVTPRTGADEKLTLKFEIVKHVIEVRLAENKAVEDRRKLQAQKTLLMDILARKEAAAVEGLDTEEIKKRLAELDHLLLQRRQTPA